MEPSTNANDVIASFLPSMGSADGIEEVLKVASEYALQLPARQIQALCFIDDIAHEFGDDQDFAFRLKKFKSSWLELKRYNNSGNYVQRALDSISWFKFAKQGMMDVNVQKK